MKGRAALVAAMALLPAAPAGAATLCVGPDPCHPTLAAALEAAQAGDRIEVGAVTDTSGPWASATALTIVGVTGTVLEDDLELTAPEARLTGVAVTGQLRLGGHARRVRVLGGVRLLDGPADGVPMLLSSTVLGGEIVLAGGEGVLDSVQSRPEGGDGVRAECAELSARHLTVVPGEAGALAGVRAVCAQPGQAASVGLLDSVVWGEFSDGKKVGDGQVLRSLITDDDPGFTSADDLRPAVGSPMLDAADSAELGLGDVALEDAGGLARVADGDGDGVARRDIGAHERPAPAVTLPAGNLLKDPGAEDALTAWRGPFAVEAFGVFPFPSVETGLALGAGSRFFTGGAHENARAAQVVDLSGSAPEIDAGGATATLGALLGGYRADGDEARVLATFLDPHGATLGTLSVGPVTPAERGGAVTLLPRSAASALPPLTRSVEVALVGTRSGASYNDAYFDNVSLVAAIPGLPPLQPPGNGGTDPGGEPGGGTEPPVLPRPFAGVTVLSSTVTVDRRGWAPLRVGCASATVGSCSGVLTLTTIARAGKPAQRLGSAKFSLTPGRLRRVPVRIVGSARRTLTRKRQLRVRLYAAARDGQGQARATTSPLRLRRAR